MNGIYRGYKKKQLFVFHDVAILTTYRLTFVTFNRQL